MIDDPINLFVGARIKGRREELSMSQTVLGEAVDVTFQCIGRYEKGLIDISVTKLCLLAKALDKPVGYFLPAFDSGNSKE